jgi:hypothetical protein
MASTINALTTGGGGIATTADSSGILQLQTASTTALTINASQNATFAGTVAATSYTGDGSSLTGTGGMTLLGTMTATASTNRQYSITGLTLTSYKQLYISATMSAGASTFSISNASATVNGILVLNNNATSSGFGWCDLGSGNGVGYYNTSSGNPGSPGNTLSTSTSGTGITNSTTTVYGYFTIAGTFTFTVNVYGVK